VSYFAGVLWRMDSGHFVMSHGWSQVQTLRDIVVGVHDSALSISKPLGVVLCQATGATSRGAVDLGR
jgi:hypothetical protein